MAQAQVEQYDLGIIGAGSGGLIAALGGVMLGAKTILFERDKMGGDCLNTGCVPSKGVIEASLQVAGTRWSLEHGLVEGSLPQTDPSKTFAWMRGRRKIIEKNDSVERFTELGVEVHQAAAQFINRDTVQAGERTIRAKRWILATGSRAVTPPIPGLDQLGERVYTNENFFEQTLIPKRWMIIGGGPIGLEMSQTLARLGCEVHLLELGARVMRPASEQGSARLHEALKEAGVQLHLGIKDLNFASADGEATARWLCGDKQIDCAFDRVLVATGRAPVSEGLGLDKAGVKLAARGAVEVNARLRTSNKRIYAVGDITGLRQFTHAADAMAQVAVANALVGARRTFVPEGMVWSVYTHPELAHVGLSDAEARSKFGDGIRILEVELDDNDRNIMADETSGYVRLVARKNGKLLGAEIFGPRAGEMIHIPALAIAKKMKVTALASFTYAYPTYAQAVKRAANQWYANFAESWMARLLRGWVRLRLR